MKLPRKLIIRIALQLKIERGEITQYDVHDAVAKHLGRPLTQGEKVRITRILEDEFGIKEVKRDWMYRVYIF